MKLAPIHKILDVTQKMYSNISVPNLLCIIFIGFIIFIFYADTVGIFLYGEIAFDFQHIKEYRKILYLDVGYATIRPVKHALLDLIRSIFGLNPLPYHALALCMHFANSILVFYIIKRIFTSRILGFLAALLFATFWADPEAVAYPAGVHECLAMFFSLYCLISFCKYRENPTRSNYLLTLFVFAIALGCKEDVVISLPLLIYLVDRYLSMESREAAIEIRLNKASYIPFLLISTGWFALLIILFAPERHIMNAEKAIDELLMGVLLTVAFPFTLPVLFKGPQFGYVNLAILAIFYFVSPAQIRKRVLLIIVGFLAVSWYVLRGSPGLRNIYFPSAFSMSIFTICLYNLTLILGDRVSLKENVCKWIAASLVAVLVYSNYICVNGQLEYYKRVGKISEAVKKVIQSTPQNTINQLVFVNFPVHIEPRPGCTYCGQLQLLLGVPISAAISGLYGVDEKRVFEATLLEVWNGRHLPSSSAQNISPQQFEELAKKTGNKVYFFNHKDDSIHDVTGKDLLHVKKLVDK